MNETRVARKILDDKPGGKRRGRRRLRWLDDVEADLRSMGIMRWRTKVLNREEWTSITKEAKAKFKGLQCYRRRRYKETLFMTVLCLALEQHDFVYNKRK
jgi:hypothetical protein